MICCGTRGFCGTGHGDKGRRREQLAQQLSDFLARFLWKGFVGNKKPTLKLEIGDAGYAPFRPVEVSPKNDVSVAKVNKPPESWLSAQQHQLNTRWYTPEPQASAPQRSRITYRGSIEHEKAFDDFLSLFPSKAHAKVNTLETK